MPDFPAGSLFLGARLDPKTLERTDQPVVYEAANFTTHGVIVGMTGSGKTGLGMVLLEETLLQGIPVLVLDPKGDMGNLALTFPELEAAQFRPYVNEAEARRAGKTVDQLAVDTAASWKEGLAGWGIDGERIRALRDRADVTIYTPGSNNGVPLNLVGELGAPKGAVDEEALHDEIQGLVSSLLGLIDVDSDPLSGREHILLTNLVARAWSAGTDVDLPTLVGQVRDPPVRKLGVIDLDTFFPPKDRTDLALRLNGLLASPAFAAWSRGAPIDIGKLLYGEGGKPRAAIVQLGHLTDPERQFVVTLILSKLVTWFRGLPGTPELRALVYMDEVFGFVPPSAMPPAKKPILTIFKQARAFGVGMVVATQNPVDIDYKVISNAGTWLIGRLQTERDKARLMDGLTDAAGSTDLKRIADTIGGLGKRQFLFHTTRAEEPFVFTSRWAMSYLPGPLSREQTAALMRDRREPPAVGVQAPAATPPSDDESTLAPTVAAGVRVAHLDPAAPWASTIGASPDGRRLQAAVVARCRLLFDDDKAGVREQQEWEAVLFPIAGAVDPGEARNVDYDDRDLRDRAPDGAVFVLPTADVASKAFWTRTQKDLADWLYRNRSLERFTNRALKLFSRPGESRDAFLARCRLAADEATDVDADKLRQGLTTKMDRVREAMAKAEDRIREVGAERTRKGLDAVVSVAGGLLGGLFGGKKNTRSILSTLGVAASKTGTLQQAGERLETAQNRLGEEQDELQALEQELRDRLQAIADGWDQKADQVETLEVPLEKTDITVEELALVWVPTR